MSECPSISLPRNCEQLTLNLIVDYHAVQCVPSSHGCAGNTGAGAAGVVWSSSATAGVVLCLLALLQVLLWSLPDQPVGRL